MRPYHHIPIIECNEPLVKIPTEEFVVETPHAYMKLGANYNQYSPYYLRQTVLNNLLTAQNHLQLIHPHWHILVFDAYRPIAVQQFMVDYTFAEALKNIGIAKENLTQEQENQLWLEVYDLWAEPSLDENTPPPHSTGSAVDISLVDDAGNVLDMGSMIDEMSDRSYPEYYAHTNLDYHHRRELLHNIMLKAGFQRNPREWWHFSYGDQMWAWLSNHPHAHYGRVE